MEQTESGSGTLDTTDAEKLWRQGERKEALNALRSMLLLDPSHAEGWYLYGAWSRSAGKGEIAAEAARIALELQPAHVGALGLLQDLHSEGFLFDMDEVAKRRKRFSATIGSAPQFHLEALDFLIPRRDESGLRAVAAGPDRVAAATAVRALKEMGFAQPGSGPELLSEAEQSLSDALVFLALGRNAAATQALKKLEPAQLPASAIRRALLRAIKRGRYARIFGLAKEYRRARPNNQWAQELVRKANAARLVDSFEKDAATEGLAAATARLDTKTLGRLVLAYHEADNPIIANAILSERPREVVLAPAHRRAIARRLRTLGFWATSTDLLASVANDTGAASDASAYAFYDAELAFLEAPHSSVRNGVVVPDGWVYDADGPALHVVGKALPETQSGYTLRTQNSLEALAKLDTKVEACVLPLQGRSGAQWSVGGVKYHGVPTPSRSRVGSTLWMEDAVKGLADVVAKIRPSVLHPHSDFYNAVAAEIVGDAFGVPVVYETRGFWEETWISRTQRRMADEGIAHASFDGGPAPDAYRLRQQAESAARKRADRVLTLANVMRDHIEKLDGERQEPLTLVPNAVSASFAEQEDGSKKLREEYGIAEDEVVIGYVSSLVEYEGVGSLIDGFAELKKRLPSARLKLLVVGDGPEKKRLEKEAKTKIGSGAIFTGKVNHSEIADYYRAIDIFVVPRIKAKVTELVTPLKPFEALALGVPVVVSDVPALLEIAEDTQGAVLSFAADDPNSLAGVLESLVLSPEVRAEMGARGKGWVLENRTWDANAAATLDVYHELGAYPDLDDPLVFWAERIIRSHDLDPEIALAEVSALTDAPPSGWFHPGGSSQSVEELRSEGWRLSGMPPVDIFAGDKWAELGPIDRSWGFHFHTWEYLQPFVSRYDDSGEIAVLSEANDIALSWAEFARRDVAEDSMAWYDMSLSLRTPVAISLLTRVAKIPSMKREALILLGVVLQSLDALEAPSSFKPGNNHGFYAAASQAHAAAFLPSWDVVTRAGDTGEQRLAMVLDRQFAPDGGHLEHSPGYHEMLLRSFEGAAELGLITKKETLEALERAEVALGWMMMPDGKLAPFGDSTEVDMRKKKKVLEPSTRFLQTEGKEGTPNSEELFVLPASGYAMVRSPQPQRASEIGSEAYLAMQAGFHSRAHKHADDLTIIWYDLERPILVDGGRYGYGKNLAPDDPLRAQGFFYEAKERQYVESTIAHNTIEVDGQIHDRLRKPYGALPIEASQDGDRSIIIGRAEHGGWTQERTLTMVPHASLHVSDTIHVEDGNAHEAISWFNLNGEFELISASDSELLFDMGDGQRLRVFATVSPDSKHGLSLVSPVRGQSDPIRGWRSIRDRELIPCWSFGYRSDFESPLVLAVNFEFERAWN